MKKSQRKNIDTSQLLSSATLYAEKGRTSLSSDASRRQLVRRFDLRLFARIHFHSVPFLLRRDETTHSEAIRIAVNISCAAADVEKRNGVLVTGERFHPHIGCIGAIYGKIAAHDANALLAESILVDRNRPFVFVRAQHIVGHIAHIARNE